MTIFAVIGGFALGIILIETWGWCRRRSAYIGLVLADDQIVQTNKRYGGNIGCDAVVHAIRFRLPADCSIPTARVSTTHDGYGKSINCINMISESGDYVDMCFEYPITKGHADCVYVCIHGDQPRGGQYEYYLAE